MRRRKPRKDKGVCRLLFARTLALIGKRFGRLTVLAVRRIEPGPKGRTMVVVKCKCGRKREIVLHDLRTIKACMSCANAKYFHGDIPAIRAVGRTVKAHTMHDRLRRGWTVKKAVECPNMKPYDPMSTVARANGISRQLYHLRVHYWGWSREDASTIPAGKGFGHNRALAKADPGLQS